VGIRFERDEGKAASNFRKHRCCMRSVSTSGSMRDDVPELSAADFERSITARVRRRIAEGRVESGADIVAIRRFVGLTEVDFAHAFGILPETLRDWEAGRSRPEGPALSLLRVAARHPRAVRKSVPSAA
jgi:DNA-binding transcriptional regulator YiaG